MGNFKLKIQTLKRVAFQMSFEKNLERFVLMKNDRFSTE